MDLPVPVWNDPGSLSGEINSKEETMAKNLCNVTAPATITGVVEASDDKDAAEKFRALVKAIFGQSGMVVSVVGDPKVTAVAMAKAGDKSKASDEDEEEEEEDEDEEDEDEEEEEEEEEDEKPAKKSAGKKADKKPEGKKVKIKLKG